MGKTGKRLHENLPHLSHGCSQQSVGPTHASSHQHMKGGAMEWETTAFN